MAALEHGQKVDEERVVADIEQAAKEDALRRLEEERAKKVGGPSLSGDMDDEMRRIAEE